MPSQKVLSLQDILKRRQQDQFVGREQHVNIFSLNMGRSLDDDRRRFLFNVAGQGGVGKSTLLRRFRHIAEANKAIIAWTEETEEDVPAVMGRISEQLEQQGHALRVFNERYRVYRQKRQELEADPEAPEGFSAILGRTLAKAGIRLARRAPVLGVALEFVDDEAAAEAASHIGELASFVTRRLTNKDEVRLVLEPVEVLTPLFLQDLQNVLEHHLVTLFFDTYEQTSEYLDGWLRRMIDGRYGSVPGNVIITIAGRHELDKNHWALYEGVLVRFNLEPFSEEEAREYLLRKGVTNESVIINILHLSGRLPLLVATLAVESPSEPDQVGDPSDTAVERFLKWVETPKQQRIALDAALARYLNRDVVAALVGSEEAEALFEWLQGLPFVESRAHGWVYHDVVRDQMLRHKRRLSRNEWIQVHGKLAQYYEELHKGMDPRQLRGKTDEALQNYMLESLYHRLCQESQDKLPFALNGFLSILEFGKGLARRWAETILRAGEDTDMSSITTRSSL